MNKRELLKKVNKIQWEGEWDRRSSTLVNYAIIKAWTTAPKNLAGHFNNIIIFNKDYFAGSFIGVKDLKKCSESAYRQSIKNSFIGFYERGVKKACRKLIKFSKFNSQIDLLKQYNQWVKTYIEVLFFVAHIRIFNRIGEAKLKEFIVSKIKSQQEQIKSFSILSATTRDNAFTDFHQLMFRAYKASGNERKKLIEEIVENFKWFPVGYGDELAWTKKDIEEQLKNFKPFKKPRINKEKIIKKLKPPAEIKRLIKIINLFVYYKDYLRRICNWAHYYSRPIFEAIGKKYGLKLKGVKMFTPEEIGKIKPCKDSTLFADGGKIYHFNYLKELKEKLASFKQKEIKGTVANAGRAAGKVVIINEPRDLKKSFKNCILVSVMTSPDLMLATKKAKAIITDEGGITSHAAIISRELRIPCIIGTKIATKVLKGGDLVEVDANKGIVRIIKKAK